MLNRHVQMKSMSGDEQLIRMRNSESVLHMPILKTQYIKTGYRVTEYIVTI